ncbi:MAG: hypothetical protein GC160_19640 [Acidobacteria bacterium]|nr:hypothetical protein [Acidobacteriota bacterium]
MASQRLLFLTAGAAALTTAWLVAAEPSLPRFLADDPIWREPPPRSIPSAKKQVVDALYDFYENSFYATRRAYVESAGSASEDGVSAAAQNVNTVGGVPDSPWYVNRHGMHPMTNQELARGPGDSHPPTPDAPWKVIAAKQDGVSPGFLVEDGKGDRYLLKFDPPDYPELASAADVIVSKILYAAGYNTPENYVVYFPEEQLQIDAGSTWKNSRGGREKLTKAVIERMLRHQPKDDQQRYRALASRFIPGEILGPFLYEGLRGDDPNDVVRHQFRRDLRGLRVFAAWTNHTDAKSINTLDSFVQEGGRSFIRHYLIDFGSSLGSDSLRPKDPRLGHEYFLETKPAGMQIITLGLYVPLWARADAPKYTGVGQFEAESFVPQEWKPNYPNPAFLMMDQDDAFWAAKQVARFDDDQIRAMVATGQYTDPRAADWVTKTLIERRDKIADAYLTLPIDAFRVENGELKFDSLLPARPVRPENCQIRWSTYDNVARSSKALTGSFGWSSAEAFAASGGAGFLEAQIDCPPQTPSVSVFLRRRGDAGEVAGVERRW